MTNKSRYLIEYRVCGKFRLELREIKSTLNSTFPQIQDFDYKYDLPVFHISLLPPLINQNKEFVLESIREAFKDSYIIEFKTSDYGFFDNPDRKPLFQSVEFGKDFIKARDKLIDKLETRQSLDWAFEKTEGFNPHVSLGFVDGKRDAEEIVHFLNKNYLSNKKQILDRVTILNGSKMLWEYDIFNHKVLTRVQALRHRTRLDNIARIIEIKNKNSVTSKAHKVTREAREKSEGRKWTEDEESQLIQLFEDGSDITEIATTLNREPEAVFFRLMKLGFSVRESVPK